MGDYSEGEEKRKRGKGGEKRERIVQCTSSSIFFTFSLALVLGIYVGRTLGEKCTYIM